MQTREQVGEADMATAEEFLSRIIPVQDLVPTIVPV